METSTVDLRETRTHRCRWCVWTQIQPGMGIAEVHEGKTVSGAKVTGRYLITEIEPTYCRCFKVQKEVAAGGTIYWVSIGHDGDMDQDGCDCQGFESSAVCKHVDSIRALIDQSEFIPEDPNAVVQCIHNDMDYLMGGIDE